MYDVLSLQDNSTPRTSRTRIAPNVTRTQLRERSLREYTCEDPCGLLSELKPPFQPLNLVDETTRPSTVKRSEFAGILSLATGDEICCPLTATADSNTLTVPGVTQEKLAIATLQSVYEIFGEDPTNIPGASFFLNSFYLAVDCPGWLEYVQKLMPDAYGYGIGEYNMLSVPDPQQFGVLRSENLESRVEECWEWVVEQFRHQDGLHALDAVICDTKNATKQQLISELLLAVNLLKIQTQKIVGAGSRQQPAIGELVAEMPLQEVAVDVAGGNLVMRVGECTTEFERDLLYLASCSFEWVTLFRPYCSVNKYLVGYNCTPDLRVVEVLEDVIDNLEDDTGGLLEGVPESFTEWLEYTNNATAACQVPKKIDRSRYLLALGLPGCSC